VIAAAFGLEQGVTPHFAFREQLPNPRLLLVGHAGGHRTGGHEDSRKMPERQRTDEQPRDDLVANAKAQRAIEHTVRERDSGRHGDHIATEQRQLHAGVPLRHSITHRRHAARDLRGRAGIARCHANEARITLEGLMRGQHVVISGDDGKIRPAQILQCVFVT